jgi:hypothetical protein
MCKPYKQVRFSGKEVLLIWQQEQYIRRGRARLLLSHFSELEFTE